MELSALLALDENDFRTEQFMFDLHGNVRDNSILDVKSTRNVFDDYDVSEKVLGDGSYSVVFRGQRRSNGEAVAVKTISKHLLFTEEERQAVKREIEYHSVLSHPNIIALYDTYETHLNIHMVLELCDGLTLDQFAKRCPGRVLTEPQARTIFYQILSALSHLAETGLIHGDVKPQNILLQNPALSSENTEFRVKLCDFGMARPMLGETRGVIGTTGFIAPEILNGHGYSCAADMWSLGVTLYLVLFGVHPFDNANDMDLTFPPQPHSNEAKDLITNLLCYNTRKRLHAAQCLSHPFFRRAELVDCCI